MIARTRGLSSLIWATPIYRTRRATRRRTASPAVHDRNLCKPTGMICAPRPAIPSSNWPTTANVEVRRPTPSTAAGATPVSAAAEVAGERRYLTVMFCNLVESASTTGRSISTGLWINSAVAGTRSFAKRATRSVLSANGRPNPDPATHRYSDDGTGKEELPRQLRFRPRYEAQDSDCKEPSTPGASDTCGGAPVSHAAFYLLAELFGRTAVQPGRRQILQSSSCS